LRITLVLTQDQHPQQVAQKLDLATLQCYTASNTNRSITWDIN
jgi:hypothetical protein